MKNTVKQALKLRDTRHPLVYEVNTRVLLNEQSALAGRRMTLATLPERLLDEWASFGFDAIWLMGVWTTGKVGLEIARSGVNLREEYRKVLPDLTDDDIIGSPYAVQSYTVSRGLGGNAALLALRKRLGKRRMGLILDFVSNHTARDHAWVRTHPEYYIHAPADEALTHPDVYFGAKTVQGERAVAFGKDPHFPGWTDTAQLNYRHPGARKALIQTLKKVASMCDGVRCDLAMLVLEDVFSKTWGERATTFDGVPSTGEFWSEAIGTLREKTPGFLFIAEAYWNLEWRLQQLGFDFTYDKTLCDRLLHEGASSVYDHLKADLMYQEKCIRFIENHDERRAAEVMSSEAWVCAAATLVATVPGMVLIHDGQLEARKVKLPVQLGRRPAEEVHGTINRFYRRLLSNVPGEIMRNGSWSLLKSKPAWHDNSTWQNCIAYRWRQIPAGTLLIVVNYAPHNSQCYVELDLDGIEGGSIEFRDMMGDSVFVRDRHGLLSKGMYFDLPPYGLHIFSVNPLQK